MKEDEPGRINAEDYEWDELYGLQDILNLTQGRQVHRTVEVRGEPKGPGWGGYGTRLNDVREAVELEAHTDDRDPVPIGGYSTDRLDIAQMSVRHQRYGFCILRDSLQLLKRVQVVRPENAKDVSH